MDFPRPAFDTHKATSSLVIFTEVYLTLIKTLKGTIGVTMVSTILWFYLCLISLPIHMIKCLNVAMNERKKIRHKNINNKLKYMKSKKEKLNKQNWKKKVSPRKNT